MSKRPGCEARQYSDQMQCGRCGLAWDVNDPDEPDCLDETELAAIDSISKAHGVPKDEMLGNAKRKKEALKTGARYLKQMREGLGDD